jgi:murein tripeptide amidase MpaA
MRVPDPNGDWKISNLDPRLMEKRSPTDSGEQYYRLLPEGLLHDFDGYVVNLRLVEGLDFNHFYWNED